MNLPSALADEVMTITHFRLMWRHFGTTPALQEAILAGTGMRADMLDTATTVTMAQQYRQIANLNALLGPGWYLDAREQLHFSAHGALTVAALSAPTLADALAVLETFVGVRLPIVEARLSIRGAEAVLAFEPRPGVALDPEVWRPFVLTSLISVRTLVASILADPDAAVVLEVAGPRPAYAAALEAAYGSAQRHDAALDAVAFPAAWLAARSALADPALYASALATLNSDAATRARPPRALRYRVEQILAEHPAGRMDAAACARALGLSRRTMTRRLAEEGAGFRQLLDADLRRRALALVEAGTMNNARIADMLGYQDPTSFHRAMQRWTRPVA